MSTTRILRDDGVRHRFAISRSCPSRRAGLCGCGDSDRTARFHAWLRPPAFHPFAATRGRA
jgi:hypothetical protein